MQRKPSIQELEQRCLLTVSCIDFTGNLVLGSSNNLIMEIGGTTSCSEYDALHVTGNASLDGNLEVQLIDGFVPTAGDRFEIITFGSVTGDFSTFDLPTIGGGLYFGIEVDADSYDLVVSEAPAVTDVRVHGSGWDVSVNPYSIPVGDGDQLLALPWVNINEIEIEFDQDVIIEQDDLVLNGINVDPYSFSGFNYDQGTMTATWTLSADMASDKVLIELSGSSSDPVRNAYGIALDGYWDNPVDTSDPSSSTYPSGNDTPGTDFEFRFNVLPGDVEGNGVVNVTDWATLLGNLSTSDVRSDINASGAVNVTDWSLLLGYLSTTLPDGEPTGDGFGVFSLESSLEPSEEEIDLAIAEFSPEPEVTSFIQPDNPVSDNRLKATWRNQRRSSTSSDRVWGQTVLSESN